MDLLYKFLKPIALSDILIRATLKIFRYNPPIYISVDTYDISLEYKHSFIN